MIVNISQAGLDFIFHEAKLAQSVDFNSLKCGITLKKMYDLSYAYLISNKVKHDSPIQMDEVCTHWKKIKFDDDGTMKDGKINISILTEWEVIQETFLKADDNMKLHIKEKLRKVVYPETIYLKLMSQPVKTKGSSKKVKPTPSDNSTI